MPDFATLRIRVGDYQKLLRTMTKLKKAAGPNSPAIRAALIRSAAIIIASTKLNIRQKKIVDRGLLMDSIRYEFAEPDDGGQVAISVGSFGVNYAALHEFGDRDFSDRQRRAMFAALRERGVLGARNKSVLQGREFRARPFLRPAFHQHKGRVTEIIAQMIGDVLKGD